MPQTLIIQDNKVQQGQDNTIGCLHDIVKIQAFLFNVSESASRNVKVVDLNNGLLEVELKLGEFTVSVRQGTVFVSYRNDCEFACEHIWIEGKDRQLLINENLEGLNYHFTFMLMQFA